MKGRKGEGFAKYLVLAIVGIVIIVFVDVFVMDGSIVSPVEPYADLMLVAGDGFSACFIKAFRYWG